MISVYPTRIMNVLRRSTVAYEWHLVGAIYILIMLAVFSCVGVMYLLSGDGIEESFGWGNGSVSIAGNSLVGGSVYNRATDDGFMGFVRLIPLPDCSGQDKITEGSSIPVARREGGGCGTGASCHPLFSERDLMCRLAYHQCTGIIFIRYRK